MDANGIDLRSGKQRLWIDSKRILQARYMELSIADALFGDDDPRLGLQPRDIGLPMFLIDFFRIHLADLGDVEYRSARRKLLGGCTGPADPGRGSLALGDDAVVDD